MIKKGSRSPVLVYVGYAVRLLTVLLMATVVLAILVSHCCLCDLWSVGGSTQVGGIERPGSVSDANVVTKDRMTPLEGNGAEAEAEH